MFKIKLFNIGIFLLLGFSTFAIDGKEEFVKEIKENFNIKSDGALSIAHQHGNLNLTTWDKNKVDFKIKIIVMAKSKEQADEIFDRVTIDFVNTNDTEIKAKTIINRGRSGSWWGGNNWSENDDFKIVYDVKLPRSLKLSLSNKYGNTFVPDMDDNIAATQSYGNIKIGDTKGNVALTLKYGDAAIKSATKLSATLSYGKADIGSVKTLAITSKYSEIQIDNADKLSVTSSYDDYEISKIGTIAATSRYDDYTIEEVTKATFTGGYSDFSIGKLHQKAIATLKYGDLKIESVGNGFEGVIYTGSYADLQVNMGDMFPSKLIVNASYGGVTMPEAMNRAGSAKSSSRSNEIVATHPKGKGEIIATVKYADVVIK